MPSLKRVSERPSETLHTSPSEVVTRTPTTLSVSFSALNRAGCGGKSTNVQLSGAFFTAV